MNESTAKILDGLAARIAQPLDKAANAVVRVADRADKALMAAEYCFTYGPWIGGSVVGLLAGLLIARITKR